MNDLNDIEEKFPFLSGIKHHETEYIGIVQNTNDKIISFYDFNAIRTQDEKQTFLEFGDTWWWESNRLLPINIFLNGDMRHYRYCLKTITSRDTTILFGPTTSLNNLIKKRIKKRQISLIKKT